MNSKRSSTAAEQYLQRQHEIDLYILQDDSFEREAFEARMLEDESLAMDVAEAVRQFEVVASVCKASKEPKLAGAGRNFDVLLPVCIALAMLLLVAVFVPFAPQPSESAAETEANRSSKLTVLAEQWVALSTEYETEDATVLSSSTDVEWVTSDASQNESDWVLEAAQQYFQEMEI